MIEKARTCGPFLFSRQRRKVRKDFYGPQMNANKRKYFFVTAAYAGMTD